MGRAERNAEKERERDSMFTDFTATSALFREPSGVSLGAYFTSIIPAGINWCHAVPDAENHFATRRYDTPAV